MPIKKVEHNKTHWVESYPFTEDEIGHLEDISARTKSIFLSIHNYQKEDEISCPICEEIAKKLV